MAAGVSGPGAAGRLNVSTIPAIYVEYNDDCSFAMRVDGGIGITSSTAPGATIPPGLYEVVLRAPENPRACPIEFQFTGPGVQLFLEYGGEGLNDQRTETLLPAATYVAVDLNDPARTRRVFTTAASGSSSTLVTQAPSTATGPGQVLGDLVGSAILPYRGTLHGTVASSGAVALTARGTSITSVRAGRYDVAVDDRTSHGGFAVEKLHRRAVAITGAAFVGRRTSRVDLTPGTWLFYSKLGQERRVVVVA